MCKTVTSDPIIVVRESGRRFTVNNAARRTIGKYVVDGCLIDDPSRRCDYMFCVPDDDAEFAFLVELKGCRIKDAFDQLRATLSHPHMAPFRGLIKQCHVVSSAVPKPVIANSEKLRFKQDLGIEVKVTSGNGQVSV